MTRTTQWLWLLLAAASLNAGEIAIRDVTDSTYVVAKQAELSFGGAGQMLVGANDELGLARGLLRFDLTSQRNHTGMLNGLRIELTLSAVTGDWQNQEFALYLINSADRDWRAGNAAGESQDGAVCWAYRRFSAVKHVRTGQPLHEGWTGGKGFSAAVYGKAPLATATISAADVGKVLRFDIPKPIFAANWLKQNHDNAGFVLVATGLETGKLGTAAFAASGPNAPRLTLVVDDWKLRDGVPIKYSLAKPGRISLLISNDAGVVVRELLHAAPRAAGEQLELWDGMKDDGKVAAPGDYSWKLLETDGLTAEYLFTLGLSVNDWEMWPGNHIPAIGVAVDQKNHIYVAAGCSEAEGMCLKMDADGKRIWTMPQYWFDYADWQGGHSAAVDGNFLYLLEEDYRIQRLSAEQGFSKKDGPYSGVRACWDVAIDPKQRPLAARPDGWDGMKDGTGRHTATVDFDVRDNSIVVSYEKFDRIRWIDPDSPARAEGTPQPAKVLFEAAVKQPIGIGIDNQGRALVISEGKVLAFTKGNAAGVEVIRADQLSSPYRLDVHPENGEIYVAERGDSQQVKRFSADGKKLLASYGRKGGRPKQGLYDGAVGFNAINDIAVAPDGSFWITEAFTAPRRTAHFGVDGKLIKEWYGGQMYANRACVDPADPSLVWMDSQWGEVIQAKVDWEKKSWSVRATYSYMFPLKGRYQHEGGMWFPRHHGGKTYLCNEGGICVLEVDEANRRLIPRAAAGTAYYPGGNEGWRIPKKLQDFTGKWDLEEAKKRDPGDQRSHRPWSYMWHDVNGDGQVDLAEMQFDKTLIGTPKTSFVDQDLNYYTWAEFAYKDHGEWRHLEPSGMMILRPAFTDAGVPVYDWAKRECPYDPPSGGFVGSWLDAAGNLFTCYKNRVAKWGPDGKRLWTVGRTGPKGRLAPGETFNIYRVTGTVDGNIVVADIYDSLNHVWDRDGLWVGRLLEQPVINDQIPKEAYRLCGENFGGSIFKHPATGLVYFLGDGDNSTPVYRIDGWDRFQRQAGAVVLPAKPE